MVVKRVHYKLNFVVTGVHYTRISLYPEFVISRIRYNRSKMNSLDAIWDLNDFVISGISLYPFRCNRSFNNVIR